MASGVVDEGMMDSSSGVDQGFLESVGIVDEGSVESRSSEGQGVGGVDQSRVRFRLGQGHGDKSENYKELHAEACLDCLVLTVIISLTSRSFYTIFLPGCCRCLPGQRNQAQPGGKDEL